MHDDAPLQMPGDIAALFARPIEGKQQARCRMQPVQRACDAIARFVEMTNRGPSHTLANRLIDRGKLPRLPGHPGHDAGRTDRHGGEQIAQGLRDAILGDQLLDIEIDRRRPDALAVLGRRDDAVGKRRLRHALAMRATVDRGLMLSHHERALGNVENLPLLDARHRLRVEPRTATAASADLVSNHGVGTRRLPQSAAFVTPLAAARLGRTTAQTSRDPGLLLQPVARRRLRTVGTVQIQSSPQVGHLRPKRGYLRPQGSDQIRGFGGNLHPTLESDSSLRVRQTRKPNSNLLVLWHLRLTQSPPAWELQRFVNGGASH